MGVKRGTWPLILREEDNIEDEWEQCNAWNIWTNQVGSNSVVDERV